MKRFITFVAILFLATSARAQISLDSLWSRYEDQSLDDSLRHAALSSFLSQGFLFNQTDSAFVLAQYLVDYGQKSNSPYFQMDGLSAQGISYGLRGEYDKSLDYFFKVLKLSEASGNKMFMAESLKNIGRVNSLIGDYEKSLDYCQQALEIQEEIDDEAGMTKSLTNIGLNLERLGSIKEALDVYRKCFEIQSKMNDPKGMANTLVLMANIHQNMKEFDKAEEYILRSIDLSKKQNNNRIYVSALGTLARNFNAKGEYVQAIRAYEELVEMQIADNDLHSVQGYYAHLHFAYKHLHKYKEALSYFEKLVALRDSMNSLDLVKRIQQVEFEKEMFADSLEQEADKLKVQVAHQAEVRNKERKMNIAMGGGFLLLLICGGIYNRYRYTKKAKLTIEKERDRSEELLLNILPAEVAEELKLKGEAKARDFDMVSILFTDFERFTEQAEMLSASNLVREINDCFKAFDKICEKYEIEKIKTIGDAYMAAGGLPVPQDMSVKNTVLAALEMQHFINHRYNEKKLAGAHAFQMRAGIHTGPIVAGIVGIKKFQYDIWGDAVNTASRMENQGVVGKVNISEATYNCLKDDPDFTFESRGKIQAKGKGEVEMYFVELV